MSKIEAKQKLDLVAASLATIEMLATIKRNPAIEAQVIALRAQLINLQADLGLQA